MQMTFDTCPEELPGWKKFFEERGCQYEEIALDNGNTEVSVLVDDDAEVARAIVARYFGK